VVGRKVTINGHPFTIIGVAQSGFSGIDVGYMPQVFVPMMMKPQLTPTWNALDDRRSRFARVFARLRPGVTPEQAEAALQPFFQAMRREELKAKELTTASAYARREFLRASIRVVPVPQGHSGLRDGFTEPLWTLMAVVIGVLLITCANVAGLLVARGNCSSKACCSPRWRRCRLADSHLGNVAAHGALRSHRSRRSP
jgi:MacB-like periplasmic core domain